MLRGVLARLAARFGGGEADEEETEDTRFIPSVLDESVRRAHGGSNTAEREIADVQEEAQRLREHQRDG